MADPLLQDEESRQQAIDRANSGQFQYDTSGYGTGIGTYNPNNPATLPGADDPSGISNVTINGVPQDGSGGQQAPTPAFYDWLHDKGGATDPQADYGGYTPEQDKQLTDLYQQQTGQSAFGDVGTNVPSDTGTPGLNEGGAGFNAGDIAGDIPLTAAGTLEEVFTGTLSTKSRVSGGITLDTANAGGVAGLATQVEHWATGVLGALETDIGNAIVRWLLFFLGLGLIIAGVLMLKPVQEAIVKVAKTGAEVAA